MPVLLMFGGGMLATCIGAAWACECQRMTRQEHIASAIFFGIGVAVAVVGFLIYPSN